MATENDVAAPYSGSIAINARIENDLMQYAVKYGLNSLQINAAKHAVSSALYADVYGGTLAAIFGEAFEIINFSAGGDAGKDRINNFLGREIQAAYPGLSADQYYDLIAYMASEDLLWIPRNTFENYTLEQLQEIMRERAFRRIQEDESSGNPIIVDDPRASADNPLCFAPGTLIDMWDGSQKPIERIAPDDQVTSYDENGRLVPGRVTRVFQNTARHVLDFHTLMVTPGHVMLCGDGPLAGRHVPLIDILRSDGAVVRRDGTIVRAATNCRLGTVPDGFVWAVTGERLAGGHVRVRAKGRIRLGTRVITPEGADVSVADLIFAGDAVVTADGLIARGLGDAVGMPFHWRFSEYLPKPEDYVLQRSALTLDEIYAAGEWDGAVPQFSLSAVAGRSADEVLH